MRRRARDFSTTSPFHMTGRTVNAEPFPCDLSEVWKIFCEELYMSSILYKIQIHAFVLMPNHFHLLLTNQESNWALFSRYFLRQVSLRINEVAMRMNQNFGGSHFRCEISSYHYYTHAYKYIYRNPVQKKLCLRAEEYEFSSLRMSLEGRLEFPVFDSILIDDPEGTLNWINTAPSADHLALIKKAMLRPKFRIDKTISRKLHRLENDSL